jgi:5-methylcytosine-specific restriction endonuclease McrA
MGEPCHIVGGGPIPMSLVRELAKDAFLKAVLHDGVNIHTVAHFGRHRPAVLQTALDLGAAPEFQGVTCADCDRRYHLEWDHVDPVANDGPTSLENLEPRCGPCHQAKTERDRKNGLLRRKERAP